MPDLDLFDKTELWLTGVVLADVFLPDLAKAAAAALSLEPHEVFVTDVRDDHVVFDVLAPRVPLESILGRGDELMRAVALVPGVQLTAEAGLHSRGVLGVLGTPAEQVEGVLAAATTLDANLRAYVARRVAVVSTGPEVHDGRIHDTNFEAIATVLRSAGYEVTFGGVAGDDERSIAGRVARMAEDGHGLVITTGGVGAEDKDRTIEAFELLAANMPDSSFVTAVLATYEVGHGRHVKPHVRVGAGLLGDVVVVALPGPTREVQAALPALVQSLQLHHAPAQIAEAVAAPIRALWRDHGPTYHHGHSHEGNH